MADVGLKIAQTGYDANTCADYQLLFNSAWPSLAIAETITVNISADFGFTPVEHNLDFYPFVMAFVFSNGVFIGRIGLSDAPLDINIGKNKVYIGNFSGAAYKVTIQVFNIPIDQGADYTNPQPANSDFNYDPDYGIKVAKEGQDATSDDLNDYIIHSRAQSPAVLSIITQDKGIESSLGGGLYQISYTNPAGYLPWIYGFSGQLGTIFEEKVYSPAGFAVQSATGLSFTSSTMTLTYFPDGGASLVVLRDPLFAANSIGVNFP